MSPRTPLTPDARNASKRIRFDSRRAELLRSGWIYFPETTLFVEKVSVQIAKWSPTGKPRFLPNCRRVYEREVFDVPEPVWRHFLEGHPLAITAVDATFKAPPKDGGLVAPDAFAVHDEEPVKARYVG